MSHLEKMPCTARTHNSDGRDGGVAPAVLFAAGRSACFTSAIRLAAGGIKLGVLHDVAVAAEVELGPPEDAYGLAVCLNLSLSEGATGAAQGVVG